MKRITSTLLIAAIPALGALSGWSPSSATEASQGGTQRPGATQQQRGPGAPGQDRPEDGDETPPPDGINPENRAGFDPFGRRTKTRGNTFEERLQGGWRLVRMDLPGLTSNDRLTQGFLNIGPSFLSMEIHALWEDNGGAAIPDSDVHTAFTAEYRFDSSGSLFCSTVIGSFIDGQTGELRWERTGFERRYRVREILNQIELAFSDEGNGEGRLVFEPYLPRTGAQKDIFGRDKMGTFGTTDIFGRKKAADQGSRDIYGRPTEAPAEKADGADESDLKLPPKGPGAGGAPLSGRGGY